MKRSLPAFFMALFAASVLVAQDEPPQTAGGANGGRGGGGGGAALGVPNPQPFDRVINKDAKSKKGMFTIYQVGERFYYEIPKKELGKQYLWNTQIAKTTVGAGYGGGQVAEKVVQWELRNNRVYLRDIDFSVQADPNSPIAEAVRNANNDTIVMAFNVAAYHDGDPVVDVSRLYNTDVPEFSARQHIGASAFDASRSFIDHISSYPDNIEAEVTATYTNAAAGRGGAAGGGRGAGLGGGNMRGTSATLVLHHSMVRLPEKPMTPRLFDERVGYFTTRHQDYSDDDYRSRNVQYIARWRLEKKDPNAAMSDPVKPITYYVDAATPKKWVPYLIKGIEDWNQAFEAAGFTHAIIGKAAPSPKEDPDFTAEDVRYSVIRWLPSTTENASGPHVSDPRTGEILNADIQFYNDVMNLARDWYFVQVGPLDPRAQKLPLPDELMGRLLEYVVCHEVGHTLGFQHNMKASAMYPADKIRDKEWVHKMGHTPSIMDYSRFNYVAQPEDGIAVEDLIPRIGPYDVWATHWGYSTIPNATTPKEEKATLDKWAREQDNTPWLRFSTANSAGADPGEETEAVGDADAVKSTALGMKNLQRVAKLMMPATTWKDGETYEDLNEVYGRVLSQWQLEMNHVAQVVGGLNSQEKVVGQEGRLFTLVPKARQQEAVKFLVDNAMTTPTWLIDPEILRRIEASGALTRIRNAQSSVLNQLLNDQRFARLIEEQTLDGTAAYTAAELLASVRKGVWKELEGPTVRIDAYRRNLQNAYLELVNTKLNAVTPVVAVAAAGGGGGRGGRGAPVKSDDEKPFLRAELRVLNTSINGALAKATDHDTRAHLEGAKDQIAKILDPKFLPPAPAAAGAAGGRGGIQ
ncbi:MAG TPA: zinc-dependent metalloprotease [Bryobacteraceae bacterium]|nr:zinc-dependent metalloprotease [Bryobacteraceae bacterium]